MGVAAAIRNHLWPAPERSDPVLSLDDFASLLSQFTFNGVGYTLPNARQEDLGSSYPMVARGGFKGNGVVFACIANRLDLFSEARFMFRRMRSGRPGDLFANPDLRPLQEPWDGGTTGDLLSRMLLYADLAGNAYVVRRPNGVLTPLRPDWVSIIGGVRGDPDASVWHEDAEVLGYIYEEGGPGGQRETVFLPDEVAHFAYRPDPEARFRGMSWITPIVREVMADRAATEHKLSFFENGATPQTVVKLDVDNLEKFNRVVEKFKQDHEGARNAYKTMFVAAGADVSVVGADLRQLEFKVTQGAGETRIAAAAGVPPVIVGLSEGLAAATYSNYGQARRRFADQTMRPLWRNVCGSLARIVRVPADAELWYDDSDISALQEDRKDAAEILETRSRTLQNYLNSGHTPESSRKALMAGDESLLEHTGLFSVQLQPPGLVEPPGAPSLNGANGQQTPAPVDV